VVFGDTATAPAFSGDVPEETGADSADPWRVPAVALAVDEVDETADDQLDAEVEDLDEEAEEVRDCTDHEKLLDVEG
jgi:hypothetical protein